VPEVGPRIAVYGKGRSFLFAGGILAALLAAACGFALLLAHRALRGFGFGFSSDVGTLTSVGYGVLTLGVIIALGFWWLALRQTRVVLRQNAITVSDQYGRRTDFYADIEDLCMFFWGGLGYRATPEDPWVLINARTTRYDDLSERLCALHVEQRGERLFATLTAGQNVSFRCVVDEVALSKGFVASRTMNHPTYDLVLTTEQLRVQGKAIPVRSIAEVKSDAWIERSAIVDDHGNLFHSVHPAAVMSFDVLCRLLQRLQDTHTAHPHLFG